MVVGVDGLFYVFFYVELVFYLAKDFFYQIFDTDDSRCAAKFIYNHSDALSFFRQAFEKFLCRICLRIKLYRTHLGS